MNSTYDYLIIGAGVIGLSIARALKLQQPDASILIIDKEDGAARHASSRNSGVLHAGFYYSADSLKARFTVEGNAAWKAYCREKGLPLNACGKLVVARDESELEALHELERRGKRNGSNVQLVGEGDARRMESNVKTFRQALYSPDTASVDPKVCCEQLKSDLEVCGVQFSFNSAYLGRSGEAVRTSAGEVEASKVINCAGLYADKVAHDFGFGHAYTMIPFKGLYLKYTKNKTQVGMNIYPVPNLQNPFLGVHFTKTVDGSIKIGPTAIPAFWRENYGGAANFRFDEFTDVLYHETLLFLTNSFHFRDLAFEEMRKYQRRYFINLARDMVQDIDPAGFTEFTAPGIRAQLLDKKSFRLVQDFVVEGDTHSVHVLNAVSPAFTCAFPFADYVVKNHILPN